VGESVLTILHGLVKQAIHFAEVNQQRCCVVNPGATPKTGNERHLAIHGGWSGGATTKDVRILSAWTFLQRALDQNAHYCCVQLMVLVTP